MACTHTHLQYYVLVILSFLTYTGASAQRYYGIADYDKARRHSNRLPFLIPRGGDNDLMDEISETIHDSFMDVAIAPWIKKHTVLIIKVRLVVFCILSWRI